MLFLLIKRQNNLCCIFEKSTLRALSVQSPPLKKLLNNIRSCYFLSKNLLSSIFSFHSTTVVCIDRHCRGDIWKHCVAQTRHYQRYCDNVNILLSRSSAIYCPKDFSENTFASLKAINVFLYLTYSLYRDVHVSTNTHFLFISTSNTIVYSVDVENMCRRSTYEIYT